MRVLDGEDEVLGGRRGRDPAPVKTTQPIVCKASAALNTTGRVLVAGQRGRWPDGYGRPQPTWSRRGRRITLQGRSDAEEACSALTRRSQRLTRTPSWPEASDEPPARRECGSTLALPGCWPRHGLDRLRVDLLPQLLAGLEVGDALRRHVHTAAGPRIAAPARLATPDAKAAEAAQFDLLPPAERLGDAAEHGLDDDSRALLRDVGDVGHHLHERRLRQGAAGHRLILRQKGCSRAPGEIVAARGDLCGSDDSNGAMVDPPAAAGTTAEEPALPYAPGDIRRDRPEPLAATYVDRVT